jgi:predicted SAM-dependent methyltransferase
MKLHLGCGKRYLEGFFHIDIAHFPHIDLISSIDKLDAFENNSCELIYSSHSLEYFDRFQTVQVLKEWNRVLKKGGRLLLTVPDFRKLVEIYLETSNLANIIGPLFGRWPLFDAQNEVINTLYHRTVWDRQSLSAALEEAGFEDVEEFDPVKFLESIDSDYDDHSLAYFPHMDRAGTQISLCLSATKKQA